MKTGENIQNVIYFKLFYIIYAGSGTDDIHSMGQLSVNTPFESIDQFVTGYVYPIYSDVESNLER